MLVDVAVPLPVFGSFTYIAEREIPPGTPVVVPFGRREVSGWVVGKGTEREELKPIVRELDEAPAFDAHQLALYRWIADYYLAPLGEVIATATPAGVRSKTKRIYKPEPEGIERLAVDPPEGDRGLVLREVISRPGITKGALDRRLADEVEDLTAALRALVAAGLVRGEDVEVDAVRDEELWVVATGRVLPSTARAPKAAEALGRLPVLAKTLSDATIATLEKHEVARREWRRKVRAIELGEPTRPPVLNAAQAAAVDAVRGVGCWLLHGVTGAGKTEVYLALAARCIQEGRQALILVPEIALTPQLEDRFAGRFPGRVEVLHSGLTGAERQRAWTRIRGGGVDVVVGARSAVFAPLPNVGLLVVDEENDDSYKQDEGVRYHGRDVAVVRGKLAACPVVLGSATPSLESWENARTGRYGLLTLRERATPRPVPTLEVVDLRGVASEQLLTEPVHQAITEALAAGGKAILLHNRRGFATFVECPGCGQAYSCPSCGVSMVYHQAVQRLDCHYCGFHRPFTPTCPKCHTEVMVMGRGTERIEGMLAELFPDVPIGRLDADTAAEKGGHARILGDFREGRTRLLVGTQIVAKGHDFPDVHVAAVLGADHVLGMPDFRSAERTFALVTQLTGRAGRGEVPGRVFLQTRHPEHPVFACIGDMDRFAAEELHLRKVLGYPPYARLVLVRIEGVDRQMTRSAADTFAREARVQAQRHPGVDVLGPAIAPLPRLVGRWRYQVVIRGRDVRALRTFLTANHTSWRTPQGVRKILDVDPRGLM